MSRPGVLSNSTVTVLPNTFERNFTVFALLTSTLLTSLRISGHCWKSVAAR